MSLELNGNLPSGESHPEGDMPQNSLHVAQVGAEETTDRGLLHQSLCCRAIPRESCWPMGVSEHRALKEHNAREAICCRNPTLEHLAGGWQEIQTETRKAIIRPSFRSCDIMTDKKYIQYLVFIHNSWLTAPKTLKFPKC